LIGALMAGGLSDKYGRKRLLILAGILFVATGVGVAMAPTFLLFVVFRILGGVGIGLASNISPMYIAEVSPAEIRGKFVSLNQLTIVIGVLLAQLANFAIGKHGDGQDTRALASVSATSAVPSQMELAKQLIAKYGPRIEREKVDEFLAQGGAPSDEAVVGFLKEHKVQLPPSYVRLARNGITPWNEVHGWRWMFGAVTLPGALFFLAMFFVPESPRWLVKNGRRERAREVLAKVGGGAFAEREVTQIQATLVNEIQKVDFRELLEPKMRKILVLGVVLAVLQQWCGINAIFYYADKVFAEAQYQVSDVLWNVVVLGGVNLAFTFLAIATVDRVGRKFLMLAGEAGLTVFFFLLGGAYLLGMTGGPVLGLVLLAMACYCCTLAPITWVILAEIFPNRIRGAAMSVSVFALWAACFALALSFPIFSDAIGLGSSFWIFSAICLAGFFFILARLPETKGKSLEQIQRELVD
jgi:MFS family permease